jgi:hypothetical protein
VTDAEVWDALGGSLNVGEALNEVHTVLTRYAALRKPEHYDVAALYAALTHCQNQPRMRFAPRMTVSAPRFGAGKTTFRNLMSCLVHRPFRVGKITPAAVCHKMGEDPSDPPVLLLDEADAPGRGADELRHIIRFGFDRGEPYTKMAGGTTVDVPTFGMVVLSGIGISSMGKVLDAADLSRAVKVEMELNDDTADFDMDAADAVRQVGVRLGNAVGPVAKLIVTAKPEMPEGDFPGRTRDV